MHEPAVKTRVLCVDDTPAIANLLHLSVNLEPDMESVGRLNDANALLEEVERTKPDVVLLDLTMPGKDSLEALAEVTAAHPEVRVIVFSGHDDAALVDQAIRAGARGFVTKAGRGGNAALLEAIRRVARGDLAIDT